MRGNYVIKDSLRAFNAFIRPCLVNTFVQGYTVELLPVTTHCFANPTGDCGTTRYLVIQKGSELNP